MSQVMIDIEIKKLCAEAMGITGWLTEDDPMTTDEHGDFIDPFDPLNDDAQAMALVKKFALTIDATQEWEVYFTGDFGPICGGSGSDLNRAICECVVAKMQAERNEDIFK